MSIPPYLTSGASSRAHHALIVALHGAKSVQEENAVAQRELRRVKDVMAANPSTGKIADCLIIVLNCLSVLMEVVDVEWALLPALQVAEAGKTRRERRMGYLYLCERLPRGHELGLMLINTIRKDLTSATPQDILLALDAIIQLPTSEIRPAVVPLLTSSRLLRYPVPAIRRKTLAALRTLHLPADPDLSSTIGPPSFPLSLRKVVNLIEKESDIGVVSILIDSLRLIITNKIHAIKEKQERLFLVQLVIAQTKRKDAGWKTHSLALHSLKELADNDEACLDTIIVWAASLLKDGNFRKALLPEMCHLIASSTPLEEALSGLILRHISRLLIPDLTTHRANPIDHSLALSCLLSIRPVCWDSLLGQKEMQSIMEGVHSCDNTIRLTTFRLLQRLSPDLLTVVFTNLIESIENASDLALPLGLPSSLSTEQKLKIGLDETSRRALEVATIRMEVENPEGKGRSLASDFLIICETWNAAQEEKSVWEEGVKAITSTLADSSARQSFISGILDSRVGVNHTLAVGKAFTVTEYGAFAGSKGPQAVESVLDGIQEYPASIQELMLVAAVSIMSRSKGSSSSPAKLHMDNALEKVKSTASGYMKKRCQQIETVVANEDLLHRIASESKSSSLPDMLEAIIQKSRPVPSDPSTPLSPASSSRIMAQSALRYDAYAPPTLASPSGSRSRPNIRTTSHRGVSSPPEQVAGDYTLFSADETQYEESSSLLDEERVDNLVGLSLSGSSGGRAGTRVADPFKDDSDPTTPRLR